MTLEELENKTAPFLKEIVEINKKYNFSSMVARSEEDIKKSKELWEKIKILEDSFNSENPVEPCPECGGERKASLSSICLNFGKCSKAPIAMGG